MTNHESIGCLGFLLSLIGLRVGGKPTSETSLPYRLRDDFLSPAEFSFFQVLRQAVGDGGVLCAKVNLGDLFFVVRPHENLVYRNKIDRKHIDFLVCSPTNMRPLVGVELDDSSHERADRQRRDDFVNEVFQAAGLPLVRIKAGARYRIEEITKQLQPYFQSPKTADRRVLATDESPPMCPKCGIPMVERTATRGLQAGQQFWGCPNFPKCREMKTRNV